MPTSEGSSPPAASRNGMPTAWQRQPKSAKRHAVQVPAVRQSHPGRHATPDHPRGAGPLTEASLATSTPSSRPFWIDSGRNTGTPSPRSTPIPEAPSTKMYPRSSNRNNAAPSNTHISEYGPPRAPDRSKKWVVPGVDGLPAEAYQRLTLLVKRPLAARLWDTVAGTTPIPP